MGNIKPIFLFVIIPVLISSNLRAKDENENVCPLMKKVLAPRDPQTFTQELNKAIEVVTLKTDSLPVGSYKFKEQKFPGDVDIFETSVVNLPKDQARLYFAERLSSVAMRIASDPDIFLSDFKAGKDNRLNINIGTSPSPGTFTGYNSLTVLSEARGLNNRGLITEEEFNKLKNLAKPNPSFDEWAELKEAIRMLTTLRWKLEELLAQEKTLRGGKKLSLADAIDGSMVKIDVFAPVTKTGGYTEVTNFFNLFYRQKGEEFPITEEMADYKKSVASDVTLYFDKKHRKLLKATKRLWLLSTLLKDNEVTAKLMPLLGSHAAALNQIIAESEVVRALLSPEREIFCSPVGFRLLKQIGSFEKRLLSHTNIVSAAYLSAPGTGLVRSIFDAIQKDCPSNNPDTVGMRISASSKEQALANLNKIEDIIKPIVERHATKFLKAVNVDPDNPFDSLTGSVNVCPRISHPKAPARVPRNTTPVESEPQMAPAKPMETTQREPRIKMPATERFPSSYENEPDPSETPTWMVEDDATYRPYPDSYLQPASLFQDEVYLGESEGCADPEILP